MDELRDKGLGTRAEAQQIVLGSGERFTSWRDVDKRIKEVERDVIARRRLTAPGT